MQKLTQWAFPGAIEQQHFGHRDIVGHHSYIQRGQTLRIHTEKWSLITIKIFFLLSIINNENHFSSYSHWKMTIKIICFNRCINMNNYENLSIPNKNLWIKSQNDVRTNRIGIYGTILLKNWSRSLQWLWSY